MSWRRTGRAVADGPPFGRLIDPGGWGDGWYRDDYSRAVEAACAEVGVKVSMFVGEGRAELCIYFEDSDAVQTAVARAKELCRPLRRDQHG